MSCQLEALKKCKRRVVLLDTLKTLPETLNETYTRMLDSIHENDIAAARRALLWLAYSERPLFLEEVAEAAVINPESDTPFNSDDRLLDPRGDFLEILGSFVTTTEVTKKGHSFSLRSCPFCTEIRLSHFSVKDYLTSERVENKKVRIFCAASIEANSLISKSCLLYLLHNNESESKATAKCLEMFPLLLYACKLWHIHARAVPTNRMPTDIIALRFLLDEKAVVSWTQVFNLLNPYLKVKWELLHMNPYCLPLYWASYLGLEAVVRMLLGFKVDVNARSTFEIDGENETALRAAARQGHEAVVRLLLANGSDIEAEDGEGNTPLELAMKRQDDGVAPPPRREKRKVDYPAVIQLLSSYMLVSTRF